MITPGYSYDWRISDTTFTKDKGKVFSCFSCGGGSSFGYKLAGFDVIGCNEIDPRMMDVYKSNHTPRYAYTEPIQMFKLRDDLPEELYHLDILDGSPPCSSFSMSGARERDWSKEKRFKEGQSKQVLDTLFFDFIDLAKKLQPKVVIAENVKGILFGKAKKYVSDIYTAFNDAGYHCHHYVLDASRMNVPQRRERVFFISINKSISQSYPMLDMSFSGNEIPLRDIADYKGRDITANYILKYWYQRDFNDKSVASTRKRLGEKGSCFNNCYLHSDKICPTLTAKKDVLVHFDKPKHLSKNEILSISSFPKDYDFRGRDATYICGMSVPPVMMANIAREVHRQWLSKII